MLDQAEVGWRDGVFELVGQLSVGILATVDGRALAYEQIGDPAGAPVFMLHGTPGCRLSGRHPDPSRVSAAGLRLVSYDRPGYGRSSRHRGRRVVDCVGDVAAIADVLELERFAVSAFGSDRKGVSIPNAERTAPAWTGRRSRVVRLGAQGDPPADAVPMVYRLPSPSKFS